MFLCQTERKFIFTKRTEFHTNSIERAMDLIYLTLDDKRTNVYISCVGEGERLDHTPVSVPRLSGLAQKAWDMRYKQALVNIRVGGSMLALIKQYAEALNIEPCTFIEKAVDFGLETQLGNFPLTLEEWAFATHDRQHYAFRMNYKLVELIDIRANKLNTNRSVWLIWAIVAYSNKLSKKEITP